MKTRVCGWLLAAALLAMIPPLNVANAQAPNPWDTPQGQACFEQWISISMAKLNAYKGSDEFNGRKPWSINKYGVLEGNAQYGPRSVAAPDDFAAHNNNKYWWMWDAWVPVGPLGTWTYPEWNGAGIENIRTFVASCVAKAGGTNSGTTPPAGGQPAAGAPLPATWSTQPNSLPGGGSLRGRNGERFSFICPPGGPLSGRLWGTDLYTDDSSICTAAVHAGLITVANGGTVTIEIRPGASAYAASTRNGVTSGGWGSWDGSFAFVGAAPTSGSSSGAQPSGPAVNECSSWGGQGKMPGCITLHGGFTGKETSYDIDLFNIACDSSVKHESNAQPALIDQLKTGRVHMMLQDDSIVMGAQLMLNSGALSIPCAPSATSGAPPRGTVINAVDNDPANLLWNCDTNRTEFGNTNADLSRCFSFSYSVPAGGITSATLHVTMQPSPPQGQDTDALVVAIGNAGSTNSGAIPQPNTNVLNMTIQVAQRQVIVGDLVIVPVWLIKANNVANINFQITYDANVVKPEGALSKGGLLDNALFSVNTTQSGNILSGFAQTSGLSGTGTILNIPFRAVGKPGDRTPLNVSVTTINDPGGGVLNIDRIPGEVWIYNKDGSFPQGPLPPSSGLAGTPPAPHIVLGDCDGDSSLTESDALCVLEMSVRLRPLSQIMDMDQSGVVDSRDAVIILQRALKKQ